MEHGALFFAVFNSAHRVMKAEQVLKSDGLAIMLIPAPRALSTDCGLAIRYSEELFDRVFHLLGSEHLMPETIYSKESETHYRIVWESTGEQL